MARPERKPVDAALELLVDAVRDEVMPTRDRAVRALMDIINWNPEARPIQFDVDYSIYADEKKMSKKRRMEVGEELDGDAQCQFVSEAYLYNLLGKDDARSLLSRFRSLAAALGVSDINELYEDCPGCGRAPFHTGVRCAKPEDDAKRVAAERAGTGPRARAR